MRSIIFAVLLASSVSVAHAGEPSKASAPGNHSTCQTAIKAQGKTHFEGVDGEYTWLSKNYPGYHLVSQSLIQCQSGPADAMKVADANGENETVVVFDLSAVWGKGLEGLEGM